jgi:tRNA threonylcarbamoyladenosine biosynthesis protein TsaE
MAIFTSDSVEETVALARDWSQKLAPNDIVALVGEIGAGKTHFVKGLLRGLQSREDATSPTFTLVHEYHSGRLPIFHFDFYRLKDRSEVEEIGFEEYFDEGGITVIEWAERFPELLPERTRWLRFRTGNESQRIITEQEK